MKKLIIILLLLLIPNICFASLNTYSIDIELDSSQFLSITDAAQTGLEPAGDFTIEFWVRPESLTGNHSIFSKDAASNRSLNIYLDSGGTLIFYLNDTSYTQSALEAIPSGSWNHVACVYDYITSGTSVMTIYVNGLVSGTPTTNAVGPMANTGSAVQIGAREYTTSRLFFDGLIDEVRFWNDVRTSAEISNNYQTELVGNEANLVSYWQLDNSLLDETTSNNDLTNNNSAVFSTTVPFAGSEEGGPCSYSGTGDWYVYYSDNCTITSDIYVNGACYFVKDAAGYFGLQADISCSGKKEVGYGFNIEQKYGSKITVRY